MAYNSHPYSPEWNWWAGADDERLDVGPCASKEEAIEMALDDQLGAYVGDDGEWRCAFRVGEFLEGNQDLAEWFSAERWLADVAERMGDNDCGSDEYGDNHPLGTITGAQIRELESSVQSAIRHWQKRNGLKLRSYYFGGSRNEEWVDLLLEEENETRRISRAEQEEEK